MRVPVYKNQEFRKVFLLTAAVCLFFLAGSAAYLHFVWTGLNRDLTGRNLALLGNVLEIFPDGCSRDLENSVASSFTREGSQEDLEKGLILAAKYGYSADLPLNSAPLVSRYYKRSMVGLIGLIVLQSGLILLFFYLAFKVFYGNLADLSLGAERIMRGDFGARFPEDGEGELPLLGFQFNQLSRRLQLTFSALDAEKQMMKDMVSGISHQLKTPLSSSRMFTELLLEGAGEDTSLREEFLTKSLSQLERMEWLIHSLLKMSRLEAGVIEFTKSPGDLAETINKAVEPLRAVAREKKQQLTVHPAGGPVLFFHDARWVAEALENIVKNAVIYTQEGGTIEVSLFETDSTLGTVVKDTGPGIPPEEISRIFERFYQGTTGGSRRGSGIGLSLAKLIIEKHGGMVQAASPKQKGAVFTVTFPKLIDPV